MANLSDKPGTDTFEWLSTLVMPENLTKDEYEYPGDRRALAVFRAIPGAGLLSKMFLNVLLKFDQADLLGSAIKVSEKQFPDLHRLVHESSEVLGIIPPAVYLKESPDLNAETFGTDEKNVYVAVTRGLVSTARSRELAFVIGHEMGHIKSQHVLYHTTAQWLAKAGKGITGLLSMPARIALLAWHRRSEITADRAGLICCQDLASAQRALALIMLGSRELADRIDIAELEGQSSKDFGRWSEVLQGHPYLPKRLKAVRLFSNSHVYLQRVLRNNEASCVPSQDVDSAIRKVLAGKEIGRLAPRTDLPKEP